MSSGRSIQRLERCRAQYVSRAELLEARPSAPAAARRSACIPMADACARVFRPGLRERGGAHSPACATVSDRVRRARRSVLRVAAARACHVADAACPCGSLFASGPLGGCGRWRLLDVRLRDEGSGTAGAEPAAGVHDEQRAVTILQHIGDVHIGVLRSSETRAT